MPVLMLIGRLIVRHAAVLLLLLAAGCATAAPVPPVSEPVVAPQSAAQPAATPVAPTKTSPAKPAATRAAPATPPAAPRVAASTAPAAPPTLDLKALEAQLRATKAIGVFTKISLKNQVDDLMKQFRDHYGGKTTRTMTALRRSYDLLIMKVLSLLQDDDRMLASAIVSSREAIWSLLSDQNTFANL